MKDSTRDKDTIQRFADGLKERLKKQGHQDWANIDGHETSGFYVDVDWEVLNAEIDEFVASFKARR